MAVTHVNLEKSDGTVLDQVLDGVSLISALVEARGPESYLLVHRIQDYDDTTFGAFEMDDFISDWERLKPKAPELVELKVLHPKEKEGWLLQLDRIEEIAKRCKREGLRLRFVTE